MDPVTAPVPTPPVRSRYGSRFDPAVGEAPFYVGREALRLTAAQFAHAKAELAQSTRPMGARTAKAAEAVLVNGLTYNQASAALGESPTYVRGAHLWALKRMEPYITPVTTVVIPDLVLRGVPLELHDGIRERVARMVEQYQSSQPAPAVEDVAPTGTPPSET